MRKIAVFALMAVFMVVAIAAAQKAPEPSPPTITLKVLSPVAGDKWEQGSYHDVAWNLNPSALPDSMKIVLISAVEGGTSPEAGETVLATFYKENPQKWAWTKVGPVGMKLKLEVRAFLPKKKVVKGSQIFNILPASDVTTPPTEAPVPPVGHETSSIQLKSPNGGEVWMAGASEVIVWTVAPSILPGTNKTVDIYLSRDGGETYKELIAKGISATVTEFKYTVTGPDAEKCLVKVTLTGGTESMPLEFDVSDTPFRIISLVTRPVEHQENRD